MIASSFRNWCNEKWYQHKDELASYGQSLPYTAQDYFKRCKFWLKREYKRQEGSSK